jgi:group I intron endonuclease
LIKGPGVYVYRFKLNKNRIYIGSAVNIAQRFRQHRYASNKFYNLVKKYGLDNIEYGIFEKVNLSTKDTFINKKLLLDREQYYLDKYSPHPNINRLAGSMLGYKYTEENKLSFLILVEVNLTRKL